MKRSSFYGRRTKIVCTIGPATSSAAEIERLIVAGMNVARLNLSHGTHNEHAHYVSDIRRLSQRLRTDIAILIDLPGPKYRTGKLKGSKATLKKGSQLVLTIRQVEGDSTLVTVTPTNLTRDVKVGDAILLV